MNRATNTFAGRSYTSRALRPAPRPVTQHRDPLSERHRLLLVVRDVDHRRAQPRVQRDQLGARAAAQPRVQVRQRLVEQERARIADDRAAERDALTLAARERRGPAVEERRDAERTRRLLHPLRDVVDAATRRIRSPNARFSRTLLCG